MTGPSVLAYARYFDLTSNYWEIDFGQHLEYLQSTIPPYEYQHDYKRLCQTLLSITDKHAFTTADNTEETPCDVANYLEQTVKIKKPDLEQVYHIILPDYRKKQKYKVEIPLLSSGGDVGKDVRRIRRGVKLHQALDDLLEDCEDFAQSSKRRRRQPNTVTAQQIQSLVQHKVQQAAQPQAMEVSKSVVKYLSEALNPTVDYQKRLWTIQQTLPAFDRIVQPHPLDLDAADFAVDSESEHDVQEQTLAQYSSKSAARNRSDSEKVKQTQSSIGTDLPSVLESFLAEDIVLTQPMHASDLTNTLSQDGSSLQSSLVIADFETPDQSSCKRRKLIHRPASPFGTEPQKGNFAMCHEASRSVDQRHFEIPVINLESIVTKLPDIDLDTSIENLSQAKWKLSSTYTVEAPKLMSDISTPSISDVFRPEIPQNMSDLEKFLGKQKKILSSEQILWKEPGLRILSCQDDCCEHLEEAHFTVEDEAVETAKKLQLQNTSDCSQANPKCHNLPQGVVCVTTRLEKFNPVKNPARTRTPHPAIYNIDETEADFRRNPDPPKARLPVLPVNQYTTNSSGQASVSSSSSVQCCSGSGSLASFMELRGRQFKVPLQKSLVSKVEIETDPIQSSQLSSTKEREATKFENVVAMPSPPAKVMALFQFMSEVQQCERLTVVFLSQALLQHKPLLIQFLESQVSDTFNLIYRELNDGIKLGPDLIVNTTMCLFITNLQLLQQRPLPGQETQTGLSLAHDQICLALEHYEHIFVLVHFMIAENSDADLRLQRSQSDFTSFCCSISNQQELNAPSITPIWLPCSQSPSASELVNAWVWRIIRQHGYSPYSQCQYPAQGTFIDDVTLWELLLVRAGLNPMAAQVVIGLLKPPDGIAESGEDASWGLRRLMQMSEEERHRVFDVVIGQRAVDRLCRVVGR